MAEIRRAIRARCAESAVDSEDQAKVCDHIYDASCNAEQVSQMCRNSSLYHVVGCHSWAHNAEAVDEEYEHEEHSCEVREIRTELIHTGVLSKAVGEAEVGGDRWFVVRDL